MKPQGDHDEFIIPSGIRETTSEDGAVLLDIEQGICFSLNPVGLKIWRLLKQGESSDRIAEELRRQFPVPTEQLLTDTKEFIAALEAKRLLRRPGQEHPPKSLFARFTLFRRRSRTA